MGICFFLSQKLKGKKKFNINRFFFARNKQKKKQRKPIIFMQF